MPNTCQPTAKQIFENLMDNCRRIRLYKVKCYLDEAWYKSTPLPFDLIITDGIAICDVLAENMDDAVACVDAHLPVIKFIE
jgi:hypothetical protein